MLYFRRSRTGAAGTSTARLLNGSFSRLFNGRCFRLLNGRCPRLLVSCRRLLGSPHPGLFDSTSRWLLNDPCPRSAAFDVVFFAGNSSFVRLWARRSSGWRQLRSLPYHSTRATTSSAYHRPLSFRAGAPRAAAQEGGDGVHPVSPGGPHSKVRLPLL